MSLVAVVLVGVAAAAGGGADTTAAAAVAAAGVVFDQFGDAFCDVAGRKHLRVRCCC